MTIVQISSIKKKQGLLLALFFLIFCTLPCQHRLKGIVNSLSRLWVPPDLILPSYFSKLVCVYLSDLFILAFVGFLFFSFRPSFRSFFWEGPSKILTLFFGASLVSILFSISRFYPLPYVKLLHFSLYLLLFNGIVSLRKKGSLSSLVTFFSFALFAVGLLESALALSQYFTQGTLGLKFLGEMRSERFCFATNSALIHLWGSTPFNLVCRASGTFSHPNILGAVLFCSLLSTLYLSLKTEKKWGRLLFALAFFFQVQAFYTTFSRSAFLAFLFSFPLFCFFLVKSQALPLKRVLRCFWGVAASFLVGPIIFFPALVSRGGFVNYNKLVQGADSERWQYAKMALEMLREHPLFGVGFTNFQLHSQRMQEGWTGFVLHSKVHNIYLLVASEEGLVGLFLFLLFLFTVLKPGLTHLRLKWLATERAFLLSCFLGLLVIGLCDFFLLEASAGCLLFFTMAALLYIVSFKGKK